jgi:hypothetical protein
LQLHDADVRVDTSRIKLKAEARNLVFLVSDAQLCSMQILLQLDRLSDALILHYSPR